MKYKPNPSILILLLSLCLHFGTKTFAADRYWVGSRSSSWVDSGNWSTSSGGAAGASVPGTADQVFFDNRSRGNCDLDANISVEGIELKGTFPYALNQGNYRMNIGTGRFRVSGGTFNGGSQEIDLVGDFFMDAGTFNCPTVRFLCRRAFTFNGGSWNHNNGLVQVHNRNHPLSGTLTFYDLKLSGSHHTTMVMSSGSEFSVAHQLETAGSYLVRLNGGKINVQGDMLVNNTYSGAGGGTTILEFNGTGNQTLTGGTTNLRGGVSKVVINKSSGTLFLDRYVNVHNGWTYLQGNITAGTDASDWVVFQGTKTISGSHGLHNVEFLGTGSGASVTMNAGDALTTSGTLKISGGSAINFYQGEIRALGDVLVTNSKIAAGSQTGTLTFAGSGNQQFSGSTVYRAGRVPGVRVDKPSGTLTVEKYLNVTGGWTHVQGNVVHAANSSDVLVFQNNKTVSGNPTFHNLDIRGDTYRTWVTVPAGQVVTVNGTLKFDGSGETGVLIGEVNALGDVLVPNTNQTHSSLSGTIRISGTGPQALSGSTVLMSGRIPSIVIDKPSGTLNIDKYLCALGNWTHLRGDVNSPTGASDMVVFRGTKTISGNHSLGNVTFYSSIYSGNFNIASGDVLTINGTLKTGGNRNVLLNGGTLRALGDVAAENTATGSGGTCTLLMAGSLDQTLDGSSNPTRGILPSIKVDKPSGKMLIAGLTYMANHLYLENGVVKTSASDLLVLIDNRGIFNGSPSSYIDGPVKKVGNDAFTFPVGRNGNYRPIVISAPGNSNDEFTAEYFDQGQSLGSTIDAALTGISDCEYWTLERNAGSSNVNFSLPWEAATCKRPASIPDFRMARWDGARWMQQAGTSANGTLNGGTLIANGAGAFGTFVLAHVGSLYVDPLRVQPLVTHVQPGQAGSIDLNISGGAAPYRVIWPGTDMPSPSELATEQIGFTANGLDGTIDLSPLRNLSYWDFIDAVSPETRGNLEPGNYLVTVIDTLNDSIQLDLRINTQMALAKQTGATVNDFTIAKSATDGWFNMDVTTANTYSIEDEGFVAVTLGDENSLQLIGLKEYDAELESDGWDDIIFGLYIDQTAISTIQNGSLSPTALNYSNGDVLKIEKTSNSVNCYLNQTLIQSFGLTGNEKDMSVRAGMYTQGGIVNVVGFVAPLYQIGSTITDITCGNLNSGAINVYPSRIGAPFTYTWSSSNPGFSSTTANNANLAAGNYTVSIAGSLGTSLYSFQIANKVRWVNLDGMTADAYPNDNTLRKSVQNNVWNPHEALSKNLLSSGNDGWAEFEVHDEGSNAYAVVYRFRDGNGAYAGGVAVVKLWGFLKIVLPVVNGAVQMGGIFGVVNGDVIRIRKRFISGTGMHTEFFRNNMNTPVYVHNDAGVTALPDLRMEGKIKVQNTAIRKAKTSFACAQPVPVFAELQKELDGAMYQTYNGVLYFKYYESYRDGALSYAIYDKAHQAIAVLPSLTKEYGLNYFDNLDLSNSGLTPGEYYTLEVKNDKGRKELLRFVYRL